MNFSDNLSEKPTISLPLSAVAPSLSLSFSLISPTPPPCTSQPPATAPVAAPGPSSGYLATTPVEPLLDRRLLQTRRPRLVRAAAASRSSPSLRRPVLSSAPLYTAAPTEPSPSSPRLCLDPILHLLSCRSSAPLRLPLEQRPLASSLLCPSPSSPSSSRPGLRLRSRFQSPVPRQTHPWFDRLQYLPGGANIAVHCPTTFEPPSALPAPAPTSWTASLSSLTRSLSPTVFDPLPRVTTTSIALRPLSVLSCTFSGAVSPEPSWLLLPLPLLLLLALISGVVWL